MSAVSPLAKKNSKAAKALFAKSPRGKYASQKANAKRRGVPFTLTFEQWYQLWEGSGRYAEMGKKLNQYCMSRHADQGAYEVGNVEIVLVLDNLHTQLLAGSHTSQVLTAAKLEELLATASKKTLSQKELGSLFGLSQPQISRLLSGKRGYVLKGAF